MTGENIVDTSYRNQILMLLNNYSNLLKAGTAKIFPWIDQLVLERKIPIRMKDITYINPKTPDCLICTQPYLSEDRIVECSKCCQHLHASCSLQWAYEEFSKNQNSTCPFCRSEWQDSGRRHYPMVITL